MSIPDIKSHFSRFLAAAPERLHFAAHSHHYWPDVTFEAHQQCWLDAARHADRKWETIFGEVVPQARKNVAEILGLSDPGTVCFAPSTHELLLRILSCLEREAPLRILTTDGEYHSFARQARRLEEAGQARVEWIPTEPFADFDQRFRAAAAAGRHDLVYVSQVFFNSGFSAGDLEQLVASVPGNDTFIVIDGYHGYCALPTDLSAIEARAFYVAGGYKYAMSGESACILHSPPGIGARPVNTGWFASFDTMTAQQRPDQVPFPRSGSRFFGSTFDPIGLYRFNAVCDWRREIGLSIEVIHQHVVAMQQLFLDSLDPIGHAEIRRAQLIPGVEFDLRGHFLTFRTDRAGELHDALAERDVLTDYRNDRLRFGFAIYHEEQDIHQLVERIGSLSR